MALTRTFIKALKIEGITNEAIDAIMDEHGSTIEETRNKLEESKTQMETKLKGEIEVLEAKITDAETSVKETETKLEEANTSLKKFDGVDVEELKTKLSEAEENVTKLTKEHSEKVEELETNSALKEKMATINFSSNYAKEGAYKDLRAKVTLKDGKLEGYDKALEELQEAQPTAFAKKQEEQNEGAQHQGGNKNETPPADLKSALNEKYNEDK